MSSKEVEGTGGPVENSATDRPTKQPSWFGKLMLFIQQVIAELKKVTTPTRKELINYTLVVLGFVVVMMAFVWGMDRIFSWLVLLVFGTPGF